MKKLDTNKILEITMCVVVVGFGCLGLLFATTAYIRYLIGG